MMHYLSRDRREVAELFHENQGIEDLFGHVNHLRVDFAKNALNRGADKLTKVREEFARRGRMKLLEQASQANRKRDAIKRNAGLLSNKCSKVCIVFKLRGKGRIGREGGRE